MPNICMFDLQARGRKSDLLKLADWLKAYYNYDDENNPRVFVQDGDTKKS